MCKKYLFLFLLSLVSFQIISILFPYQVLAADTCSAAFPNNQFVQGVNSSTGARYNSPIPRDNIDKLEVRIKVGNPGNYYLYFDDGKREIGDAWTVINDPTDNILNPVISKSASFRQFDTTWNGGVHQIRIKKQRDPSQSDPTKWEEYGDASCQNIKYQVVTDLTTPGTPKPCLWTVSPVSGITSSTPVNITVDANQDYSVVPQGLTYQPVGSTNPQKLEYYKSCNTPNCNQYTMKYERTFGDGTYDITFFYVDQDPLSCPDYGTTQCPNNFSCSTKIKVADTGGGWITPTPTLLPKPTDNPGCNSCGTADCTPDNNCMKLKCSICEPTPTTIPPLPTLRPLCEQLTGKYKTDCLACQGEASLSGKIWTAIGCVPTDFGLIIKDYVFTFGTGIAGGISFLYFLYGAFLILTSAGNAEHIEEGKQIIVSALSGLLLIIFSIFLLRIIGVDILQLPEFK